MRHVRPTLAIATCIAYGPPCAQAQTPAPGVWQFEVTPYLWAAGFSGWGASAKEHPRSNSMRTFRSLEEPEFRCDG